MGTSEAVGLSGCRSERATPVDLQTGALSLMKDLLYALELHPISRDGVLFRTGAFS